MELQAIEAENLIAPSRTVEEALANAVAAAELYMQASQMASDASEKVRLKKKCFQLIGKAEELKRLKGLAPLSSNAEKHQSTSLNEVPLSTRVLTTGEQIILLEGSKLHGSVFPPWTAKPPESCFKLNGGDIYEDPFDLTLSVGQKKVFGGWKRPKEILYGRWINGDIEEVRTGPTMLAEHEIDLVQDITADCSVVASLCAAVARKGDGFEKLMGHISYPFDEANNRPLISENGQYVFRFYFNGCFRKVVVDDRLPDSTTSGTLHVIDRQNPGLLWPALLEKAYLKVRGGYDFPGSNSGTDLWVLTGWIPEQIFLKSDELQPNELWTRIFKGHNFGDVLMTVGTGRLTEEEGERLGLTGEHDYAILDIKENETQRLVLVKNPWCKGAVRQSTASAILGVRQRSTSEEVNENDFETHMGAMSLASSPGTFWIPFDELVQNFESLYLNWNPSLFRHRQDHHFSWQIPSIASPSCFVHNPQYSLSTKTRSAVWLLLNRHFSTEESELLQNSSHGRGHENALGFISLYIFQSDGTRIQLNDDAFYRGPFVDSPQTFARFDAEANTSYTVVIAQQSLPLPKYSFTLTAFSRSRLTITPAPSSFPHLKTLSSSWTARTAGGNATDPAYPSNPQFSLLLPPGKPINLRLLLETEHLDLAVHVALIWASEGRVASIIARDVVGDSGEYRRGCALATIPNVPSGRFVIVCSTFEAGQIGNFTLRLESTVPIEAQLLPRESAGRLSFVLPVLRMGAGVERMLTPIKVQRMTCVRIVAKHRTSDAVSKVRSPLKLSLERGQGPEKSVLAVSADGLFSDAAAGVRIANVDLSVQMGSAGGLWLVVERYLGVNAVDEIDVEILSEHAVGYGVWGTGSG